MTLVIRDELKTFVTVLFNPLNNESAANSMPELGRLSDALSHLYPDLVNPSIAIAPSTALLFATSAVEVWQRGIHSFLMSCALTRVSPIWASVCGYYASHYAMRGFAHLLGHVVLFERKLVIKMTLDRGAYSCHAEKRDNKSREHRYYWKIVKDDATFSSNPLFRENSDNGPISDAAHRNRANYADHIARFPTFRPLKARELRERIEQIALIECTTPPIPDRRHFPDDLESVQIVGYHRIVAFRKFVDEILGGGNRFWNVSRDPAWARDFVDYQITESGGLADIRDSL
jgi:hypothetical protein